MKHLSYKDPGFDGRLQQAIVHQEPPVDVIQTVRQILADVRLRGDKALVEITNRFSPIPVSKSDLAVTSSPTRPPETLKKAIAQSRANVEKFAKASLPRSWKGRNHQGAQVGEVFAPLQRVGIYVPGGTAPLISTAIMTAALAKVAGVREIVVCTPPPIHPAMHYVIHACGATEIYQCGGAQAIAAMAFGTDTIRRVDKIFGPGNAYVVEAKRQVFGHTAVDLIPGPSEIAVLADSTARPQLVAADLLAQAEHGPGSRIFLITPDAKLLAAVEKEISTQMQSLSRQQYLRETLNLGCFLIHVKNLKLGVEVVERIAPEHLSLVCKGERTLAAKIRNCGAVYVGRYSPVAIGDYAAGPSHELPTGGAGRGFSGLQVTDFFRRTSVVNYEKAALKKGAKAAMTMAGAEGMDAHAKSISIRFDS